MLYSAARRFSHFVIPAIALLALVAGGLLLGHGTVSATHPGTTVLVDGADVTADGGGCGDVANPCDTIQTGVDHASDGDTVSIAAGLYTGTIDVESRSDLSIAGVNRDTVIVKPGSTLDWGAPYGSSRQVVVRVYNSTNISLSGVTLDFDTVKGNMVHGVLMWDSTGALNDNVLKNMSVSDISGGYYEITSYIRAPGYTDAARAAVNISNNKFIDTGRIGIVTHDFVDATIHGNSFTKLTNDFGYALEIGSESTATISQNSILGYDTPAASDGSSVAGIYVENCFTGTAFGGPGPQINKPVTIANNVISGNQYGVWIGCGFDQYAGNVDIQVTLQDNKILTNTDGGVFVEDEDAVDGSSVSLVSTGNTVGNNGGTGYYFNTYGDGELHASLDCDTIIGQTDGILIEDNASGPSTSVYDLAAHNSNIRGYATGVNNTITSVMNATQNWWGDASGPAHTSNPGGTGDAVTDNVDFNPWLTAGACGYSVGSVGGIVEMITRDGSAVLASPGTDGSGAWAGLYYVIGVLAAASVGLVAGFGWHTRKGRNSA